MSCTLQDGYMRIFNPRKEEQIDGKKINRNGSGKDRKNIMKD